MSATTSLRIIEAWPPGTRATDRDGDLWTLNSNGQWYPGDGRGAMIGCSPAALVTQYGPITLVER